MKRTLVLLVGGLICSSVWAFEGQLKVAPTTLSYRVCKGSVKTSLAQDDQKTWGVQLAIRYTTSPGPVGRIKIYRAFLPFTEQTLTQKDQDLFLETPAGEVLLARSHWNLFQGRHWRLSDQASWFIRKSPLKPTGTGSWTCDLDLGISLDY